jgi:B-box zinc finger
MPPPKAIVCKICGGKFFKRSYPIHFKRCQEKFALQHSECSKCGRDIHNSDYSMHKASCNVSPRSRKRIFAMKKRQKDAEARRAAAVAKGESADPSPDRARMARLAKFAAAAAAQQDSDDSSSDDDDDDDDSSDVAEAEADTSLENKTTTVHSAIVQEPEEEEEEEDHQVPEGTCEECEEAPAVFRCDACEEVLCKACDKKIHSKGARKRHARVSLNPQDDDSKVEQPAATADEAEPVKQQNDKTKSKKKKDKNKKKKNKKKKKKDMTPEELEEAQLAALTKAANDIFYNLPPEAFGPVDGDDKKAADDAAANLADEEDLINRAPCMYCDRRFALDRVYIHERACKKSKKRKRKTWDGKKKRVENTDFEMYAKRPVATPREVLEWRKNGRRWKNERNQFRSVVDSNKGPVAIMPKHRDRAKLRDLVGMNSGPNVDMKSNGGLGFEIDAADIATPTAGASTAGASTAAARSSAKGRKSRSSSGKSNRSSGRPKSKPSSAAVPALNLSEATPKPKPKPKPTVAAEPKPTSTAAPKPKPTPKPKPVVAAEPKPATEASRSKPKPKPKPTETAHSTPSKPAITMPKRTKTTSANRSSASRGSASSNRSRSGSSDGRRRRRSTSRGASGAHAKSTKGKVPPKKSASIHSLRGTAVRADMNAGKTKTSTGASRTSNGKVRSTYTDHRIARERGEAAARALKKEKRRKSTGHTGRAVPKRKSHAVPPSKSHGHLAAAARSASKKAPAQKHAAVPRRASTNSLPSISQAPQRRTRPQHAIDILAAAARARATPSPSKDLAAGPSAAPIAHASRAPVPPPSSVSKPLSAGSQKSTTPAKGSPARQRAAAPTHVVQASAAAPSPASGKLSMSEYLARERARAAATGGHNHRHGGHVSSQRLARTVAPAQKKKAVVASPSVANPAQQPVAPAVSVASTQIQQASTSAPAPAPAPAPVPAIVRSEPTPAAKVDDAPMSSWPPAAPVESTAAPVAAAAAPTGPPPKAEAFDVPVSRKAKAPMPVLSSQKNAEHKAKEKLKTASQRTVKENGFTKSKVPIVRQLKAVMQNGTLRHVLKTDVDPSLVPTDEQREVMRAQRAARLEQLTK